MAASPSSVLAARRRSGDVPAPGVRRVQGPKRAQGPSAAVRAEARVPHRALPVEATVATHPELFTPLGERKWKAPPPGVEVFPNDTGEGAWVEKWRSPKTGRWVHNYTLSEVRRRAGEKFLANQHLGEVLGALRAQVSRDVSGTGKERVTATIVHLIDKAYLRVGNEQSAREGTFGATTLQNAHVRIDGARITLEFVGKKRVSQHLELEDVRLARELSRLQQEGGPLSPLFQYAGHPLTAEDVNAYLAPFGVTAKQFRTYHATRLAREHLLRLGEVPPSERPKALEAMFVAVAAKLGHTPAVSKESYVDPFVPECFLAGRLR